ncbi:MAG: hypothetical protein ISS71_08775 [Phycisphaerae bacterium]|nr:hypothetical protein [Phycisphaerae bacterium]
MIKKRTIQYALVFFAAVWLTGCGSKNVLWDDIERLKQENTGLSLQVQSLKQEITQLAEQVDMLAGFDETTRLQDLDTLQTIRLGRRTGLYDLDEDGMNETMVVYVEPLDTAQDYVKAIGIVEVELWNLDADTAEAKLADWTLVPEEIHPLWGGNIFAGYYRLPFTITNILNGQENELTVKATFTDFLSGKVLRDQTTITPEISVRH